MDETHGLADDVYAARTMAGTGGYAVGTLRNEVLVWGNNLPTRENEVSAGGNDVSVRGNDVPPWGNKVSVRGNEGTHLGDDAGKGDTSLPGSGSKSTRPTTRRRQILPPARHAERQVSGPFSTCSGRASRDGGRERHRAERLGIIAKTQEWLGAGSSVTG